MPRVVGAFLFLYITTCKLRLERRNTRFGLFKSIKIFLTVFEVHPSEFAKKCKLLTGSIFVLAPSLVATNHPLHRGNVIGCLIYNRWIFFQLIFTTSRGIFLLNS